MLWPRRSSDGRDRKRRSRCPQSCCYAARNLQSPQRCDSGAGGREAASHGARENGLSIIVGNAGDHAPRSCRESGGPVKAEEQNLSTRSVRDAVAQVWAEVLQRDNIGPNENFFDL